MSDIGPAVSGSIYKWFKDKRNIGLLESLNGVGITFEKQKAVRGAGKFVGKSFVLTGSLQSMSRDEAKNKIRVLGGDVSESVSKNTDYVVAGSEPGSKYEDAKNLGVKILDERIFSAMLK